MQATYNQWKGGLMSKTMCGEARSWTTGFLSIGPSGRKPPPAGACYIRVAYWLFFFCRVLLL